MPLRRGRLPAIPSLRAAPGSRAQRGSGVLSFQPGWLGGMPLRVFLHVRFGLPTHRRSFVPNSHQSWFSPEKTNFGMGMVRGGRHIAPETWKPHSGFSRL